MISSLRNWICVGVMSICFHASMGWSLTPGDVKHHVAKASGQQVSVAGALSQYMSRPQTLKVEPEKITNNATEKTEPKKSEPVEPIKPPKPVKKIIQEQPKPVELTQPKPLEQKVASLISKKPLVAEPIELEPPVEKIVQEQPKPIEVEKPKPVELKPQKPVEQEITDVVREEDVQKIKADKPVATEPVKEQVSVKPEDQKPVEHKVASVIQENIVRKTEPEKEPVKTVPQEQPLEQKPVVASKPTLEDIQPLKNDRLAGIIEVPSQLAPAPIREEKTDTKPKPVEVLKASVPKPEKPVEIKRSEPLQIRKMAVSKPEKAVETKRIKPAELRKTPLFEPEKTVEIKPAKPVVEQKTALLDPAKIVEVKPVTPPKTTAKIEPKRLEIKRHELKITPVPKPRKKARKKKKRKKRVRRKKKRGSDKQRVASLAGVRGSKVKRNRTSARAGDGGRSRRLNGLAARNDYTGRVQAKLRRYQRRVNRISRGTVYVRFTILRSGRITGLRISRSSGNKRLDNAALSTVKRAAPFPSFPGALRNKSIPISVPFRYRLR